MFRHVVLLKWSEAATAEQRAAVAPALESLPAQIPEIRSYRVGPRRGTRAAGQLRPRGRRRLRRRRRLRVYRDHPVHQDVIARFIRPILESRAAVQHHLD